MGFQRSPPLGWLAIWIMTSIWAPRIAFIATFSVIFILLESYHPVLHPFPSISSSRIIHHLRALDDIANSHGCGTRSSFACKGEGYEHSAKYVESVAKTSAGCDSLERQYFTIPVWEKGNGSRALINLDSKTEIELKEEVDFKLVYGPPGVLERSPVVWLEDHGCPWLDGLRSDGKTKKRDVQGQLVMITQPSLSFLDGRSRRRCSINDLSSAVADEGALGLIIANGLSDGRLWPLEGFLDVPWDPSNTRVPSIPILSVSWPAGEFLRNNKASSLTLDARMNLRFETTFNVLCTWDPPSSTSGALPETIVIGAHLDSTASGPGIVDNGSGGAAILEWAIELNKQRTAQTSKWSVINHVEKLAYLFRGSPPLVPAERRVVWAWWAAEELGLLGSQHFVRKLKDPEETVVASINVDMIASSNGIPMIVDATSAPSDDVIPPSLRIQRLLEAQFRKLKQPYELIRTAALSSDEWSFLEKSVPAGGLLNGARKQKTAAQRATFGGMAGAAFDPCYHQSCDDIMNVNATLLELMSTVGFGTVTKLYFKPHLKDWLWSSNGN